MLNKISKTTKGFSFKHRIKFAESKPAAALKIITNKLSTTGFSLIEVLIALSIVSIASVSIIGAVSGMTSHSKRYSEYVQLAFLLKALSTDLQLHGLRAVSEGTFDTHPDYKWKVSEQENIQSDFMQSQLNKVIIKVISPDGYSIESELLL